MLDKIEPETRLYLKKVMNTIFLGLFWMFGNVIAGIFYECGFIQNGLSLKNIIYFSISIITLVFLLRYFVKIWKSK